MTENSGAASEVQKTHAVEKSRDDESPDREDDASPSSRGSRAPATGEKEVFSGDSVDPNALTVYFLFSQCLSMGLVKQLPNT